MSKTDRMRLCRGPGGCCTPLPCRHRLALADGEVANMTLAQLTRAVTRGLEGIGPQAIGTSSEVPGILPHGVTARQLTNTSPSESCTEVTGQA